MKQWIRSLGSLKLAVGLLVVIVIALAAGTIIESFHGTSAAARTVYYAPWFRVLLGLFALNVLCSILDHWPFGWDRAGFALTHGSMLIILAGALVTDVFKVDGHMALWEGEESAQFERGPGGQMPPRLSALPFTVRLESFEIDTYPGTQRPAMFRSRVMVKDPEAGRTFPAIIQMNQELSYRGYRLFQSSYQQTPERDRTILAVSRDPGQGIVFTGYTLLMAGMLTVLGTRIAQRRAMTRQISRVLKGSGGAALLLLGLSVLSAAPAQAATVPDPGSVERLRRLPVQHDGRVMPLDTLAREGTWQVTGLDRWLGTDPVALVLGWSLYPRGWATEPVIALGGGSLAAAIGLPPGTRHASFQSLAGNPSLMDLIAQARALEEQEKPLPALLKEAQKVDGRLAWMQGFLEGSTLRVLPRSADPNAPWASPQELRSAGDLLAVLDAGSPAWPPERAMTRELTYNRVRPSRLAWWILTCATALSLLAWNLGRRWLDVLAVTGLLAGFAVMTWGLAVRWQVAGRIPASNMYESMLFLGWGVALFALVAVIFLRNRLVIFNATAMAALTMVLADCLPVDPFVHPVPPVLAGTVWLAIHVPIIMVSYSVLALGVLVAHMQIGFEIFAPQRRSLSATMSDLLYWYIHVGSILLIAGILTGSIWAASSWGRYWGWDPKEVWSLIAFLAYLAILHGRLERLIGPFGVAIVSIVAFWTIIMTYVGVNFVLASGLHSYGFGSSAVVRWLILVATAEALFLGAGAFAHFSRRSGGGKGLASQ